MRIFFFFLNKASDVISNRKRENELQSLTGKVKEKRKKRYPQITLAQYFEVWCFGKGLADTEMIFALHIKRQKMNKS